MIPKPTKPFFICLILAFLLFVAPVQAWLDCPYGRRNDPYPGLCGLYVDTNNNQICDRSEATPTQEKTALVATRNSKPILQIFTFLILALSAYFLTRRFLKTRQFRLLWNLVLLATFLPVGATGILLFLNVKVPNFQFWHNQLGIIFVIVGVLHLLFHLNYFKQALGSKIKPN